jgi:hypothetical protein
MQTEIDRHGPKPSSNSMQPLTPLPLKVPKREILNLLNLCYFYTMKPLWVGALGVKIQIHYL